jgi:hypothetical protein
MEVLQKRYLLGSSTPIISDAFGVTLQVRLIDALNTTDPQYLIMTVLGPLKEIRDTCSL